VNASHTTEFDFAPRTRIVFGVGSLDRLGELTREYGGRRVLLVTDAGIVRAGHAARAESSLRAEGVDVVTFDRVIENPGAAVVDECVAVARDAGVDLLVGLGGGSSMDTAKGCNFVLTGGGRMEDYWGVGKATRPMLPLIAVPTTTGTGSECQSFALISHPQTHVKMACGDPKAAAKVALLDPQLAVSQPRRVAVCAGIDALSHAVETAVCRRRNPISMMFSKEAFRLCARAFPRVLAEPENLSALGDMLLGAAWAGTAIENSMLGAAHAAANPLTRRYGLPHGLAVGLMLPAVIRFNGADPKTRRIYGDLIRHSGLAEEAGDSDFMTEALAAHIEKAFQLAGMPSALESTAIADGDVELLAEEAAAQWTAGFNPRAVAMDEFRVIYRRVLDEHGLPVRPTDPPCQSQRASQTDQERLA